MRVELSATVIIVLREGRIAVPKERRNRVLELAHEGHPGIVARRVWKLGIDKETEKVCKTYHDGKQVSQPLHPYLRWNLLHQTQLRRLCHLCP